MSKEPFRQTPTQSGYVTTEPLPSPEELDAFYTDLYFQSCVSVSYQESYSDAELSQKRMRAQLVFQAISETGRDPGGRLLEVGFGEGFLLSAAKEAGFDILGLDYTDETLKQFHPQLADDVVVGNPTQSLETLEERDEVFSVCVLHNVLEHVPDPVEILDRLKSRLFPDGLIVVTVPNDFSRFQAYLRAQNMVDVDYWWGPPQHLQYFNTDNFPTFAAENGFDVLDLYGDFPIEFFLFHPNSNYVADPDCGKGAHNARVMLDLLLADRGLDNYLKFCRALCACGAGRTLTALLQVTSN